MNKKIIIAAAMLAFAPLSYASILFQFSEVGGDVKMTSSGTLDTTKLVSINGTGWGGVGIENNGSPGDIDIMGSTTFGGVDTWFTFNAGTNASAITTPNGPFSLSNFNWSIDSGNNSFATYAGFDQNSFRIPGIGVRSVDIAGGFWTPDQTWTNAGNSFASLGMNVGTYSVSDSRTGETITIKVGNVNSVPDSGATLALLGACLVSLAAFRRRFSA